MSDLFGRDKIFVKLILLGIALCVAGAGGSSSNDKKIAVESLKGAGWTLGEDGVWTQGGKIVEDMERA